MSTARALAHNTAVQIAGKIASTLLGLAGIGMMTRHLGAAEFGWYTIVISYLGFAGILIDFGLIPVTAQMMSEPRFNKTELFKNLLGFRFITALVMLGLAPAVAMFLPYPTPVKIAIAFTAVSFLGNAMNQVLVGLYQTKLKMHIQVAGEIIGRILLVVSLFFLIHRGAGFLWIMGAVTLSGVVYTAVLWLFAARETRVGFGWDIGIWRAIAAKMWPIAVSIMFNVVYLKGDALLLSVLRSETEVGLYGAAYRVLDIVAQLAMMMMGVWLPILAYAWSRDLKEDFQKSFCQSFDALMSFAVPMTAGVMILAEPIMAFVAGDAFRPSGGILRILALAVFGIYLGAVFGHAAVAMNRQRQTMWIYISDAVLTLAGYLYAIPRFGMLGAAWMTVFSELYAGALLFLTVRRHAKTPIPLRTFWKILFSAGVMALALVAAPDWHVMFRILLGSAVYGLTLICIGGVSKEALRALFRKP